MRLLLSEAVARRSAVGVAAVGRDVTTRDVPLEETDALVRDTVSPRQVQKPSLAVFIRHASAGKPGADLRGGAAAPDRLDGSEKDRHEERRSERSWAANRMDHVHTHIQADQVAIRKCFVRP